MGAIYDQPTTMERVVRMNTKYLVLTYFDNTSVYCYSYSNEADMFTYTAGALNYNKNKQAGSENSPNVLSVQIYTIDSTQKKLTLLHDIEVGK